MDRKRPGLLPGWQLHSEGTLLARPRQAEIGEPDLKGFKYFNTLLPLPERLQSVGTARDKAGNRELFFDQYAALLLLYFFNPVIRSMRALQRSTKLEKVQRLLGVRPTSLGSLSEATEVFTAEHLRAILQEVAGRLCCCIKVVRPRPPQKSLCRRWHRSQCPAKNGLGLVDGRPAPSGQNASPFRCSQRRAH